ncbi:MAG: SDR family oxidoreductase [Gammaproteobacteria bacterium]
MALSDYKTALVTGASSGIGAAAVQALAARGVQVYAAARRRERLDALAAATGCQPILLDICDSAAVYRALGGLEIDILVNNAGLGRGIFGLIQATPEDVDVTIATNVTALFHVLKAVASGMVERKRGHIVNIGSVAGLYPIVSSIYGASKGAVHLLSQNLRLELRGSGVRVTEICPGRVGTEFFDVAVDDPATRAKVKTTGIQDLQPQDIADAILYAVAAPWRVNVSTIEIVPNEQAFGGLHFTPVEPHLG